MADLPSQIQQMRSQGFSDAQITEMFQRQGLPPDQIMDAMRQADMMNQIQPSPVKKGDVPMPESMPEPPMTASPEVVYEEDDRARIEELAETIIDEKWADLVENINRIIEWKEKTENRMTAIETEFKALKESFDKLHMGILEKVGEYDKHIQDVGTEVKALEKVFQKVLPGFIENVSELSRITERLKK
jgi:hypothetical protein